MPTNREGIRADKSSQSASSFSCAFLTMEMLLQCGLRQAACLQLAQPDVRLARASIQISRHPSREHERTLKLKELQLGTKHSC